MMDLRTQDFVYAYASIFIASIIPTSLNTVKDMWMWSIFLNVYNP